MNPNYASERIYMHFERNAIAWQLPWPQTLLFQFIVSAFIRKCRGQQHIIFDSADLDPHKARANFN